MTNSSIDTGVVFILLKPSGKMLLQLRDGKARDFPNEWCFPGGTKDEEDKNYIETLLRETEEEYNISLKTENCELIFVYDIPGLVENNHVYVCKISEDEKPTMNEGADMKWLTIEKIEKIELAFEQRVFIPKLKDFLRVR